MLLLALSVQHRMLELYTTSWAERINLMIEMDSRDLPRQLNPVSKNYKKT